MRDFVRSLFGVALTLRLGQPLDATHRWTSKALCLRRKPNPRFFVASALVSALPVGLPRTDVAPSRLSRTKCRGNG